MHPHGIVDVAARIAIQAHATQTRKSDKFPYIIHPFMVAMKVRQHGFSDEVVAAAVLHDVLEDTTVTAAELRGAVGDKVLALVQAVSEDKDKPWEERKKEYIANIVAAGDAVKAISCADKIYNLQDSLAGIAHEGETFWQRFNRGRNEQLWFYKTFLAELKACWSHPLLLELEELATRLPAD